MRHSILTVLATITCASLAACGGDDRQPIQAPPPPPPPSATAAVPAPTDTTPPAPATPPKPPLSELQVSGAKAFADAMNAHDAKKACESYAPDATVTVYGMGDVSGRDACVAETQKWFDGFGDLKFAIGRMFQKGDMAIVEWAWTGTNTGDFMGNKATQRPAGVAGASVLWSNADGQVVKEHRYFDAPTLMMQLDPKAKPGSFRAPPPLPSSMEVHASKGGEDEQKLLDTAKAFFAAVDAKTDTDYLGMITDDYTFDLMNLPKTFKGKKDAKARFESLHHAFPDLHETQLVQIAADGMVASESEITGTQKGPLGAIKATGKNVTIHNVSITEVKDGKIARRVAYSNSKELLDQIAPAKPASPTPPPAKSTPKSPK